MRGKDVRTGYLRISLPCGGIASGEDRVVIWIEDTASGVQFIEVEVPLEEWTRCTVGASGVDVDFELNAVDRVGCTSERKTEFVPKLDGYSYAQRAEEANLALAPYEVDGWRGSRSDYGNGHRAAQQGGVDGFHVTFHRHVRADGTPVL